MIARSAYIIQTYIARLGSIPFDVSKSKRIRSAFQPIFQSPTCFTDMRTSIEDFWRNSSAFPLPSKPFLKDLGQVIFNTQGAHFSDSYDRSKLAEYLGKREDYWDPKAKREELSDYWRPEVFGYDHTLEDQRMNHLYFELRRPLFMKAIFEGSVMADGRVFIHLYPSGYLAVHLAIASKQSVLQDWAYLRQAILESRPWRSDNAWIWNTKLKSGKLSDVVQRVIDSTFRSLYTDTPHPPKRMRWHTAIKLVGDHTPQEVANNLLVNRCKTLELGTYTPEVWHIGTSQEEINAITYSKNLVSTDKGIICTFSLPHKRSAALRSFYKIHALYEFVLLKNQIYEDYSKHLRSEVVNLKEYRLSTLRKLTKEDVRRLSVFDHVIPRYLLALDNHIQTATPYFRRAYSFLSQETDFDSRRETVSKLVKDWESEAEQWEHSASLLWKQVFSPLKNLLGI